MCWIFSVKGFVSIVIDKQTPGNLLVRGRIKGDIEAMFPEAKVTQDAERDYLYRATIHKDIVRTVIAQHIDAIDYDNFKNANPKERTWLTRIWNIMYQVQEDESGIAGYSRFTKIFKKPKKGKKKKLRAVDSYGNLKLPGEGD